MRVREFTIAEGCHLVELSSFELALLRSALDDSQMMVSIIFDRLKDLQEEQADCEAKAKKAEIEENWPERDSWLRASRFIVGPLVEELEGLITKAAEVRGQ